MKKFYYCKHCGNVVELVHDNGGPLSCCGENMILLEPNTTDAASEKHVPVVSIENGTVNVSVGSISHPMEEKHYITFIMVETDKGTFTKNLSPSDTPTASFVLPSDAKVIAVYEYCNLHGLWATKF